MQCARKLDVCFTMVQLNKPAKIPNNSYDDSRYVPNIVATIRPHIPNVTSE